VAFTPVQKLSITSGAAMVILSAVGLVSYLSTMQMVDAQSAAAITNRNIQRLDRVLVRTTAAENAARRYVEHGAPASIAVIDSAQSDVEYALDSLRTASEDIPDQRRNLDSLGPIVGAVFKDARQVIAVRKKGGPAAAAKAMRTVPVRLNPVRLIAEMRNEEVRVLGEKSRVMIESGKATRYFIIAGSIFSLVLAAIALQPLRASVERRLTQSLSRTVISDDEVPPA
jgi:CHASE3 domain sensor protein